MNISQQIAKHINEVYFGGNWTCSNLKDQLQAVDLNIATTQISNLNTIATLAYHIHYFVLAQTEVLEGRTLNAKDALSFDHPTYETEEDWEQWKENIFKEAEHFIELIKDFPEEKLHDFFQEEKYGIKYRNFHGLIEHTHYHLGQIALLKKLIAQKA